MIEQDCDVLVPAAVGSQIHEGNAGRVKAVVVVEGANGPTTAEADAILHERGVRVIPDIVANAGGDRARDPGASAPRPLSLRGMRC